MQSGKPLYIPSKEKLLKYTDEMYYEETPHTKALKEFFRRKLHKSKAAAEMLVSDCNTIIVCDDNPFDAIFNEFESMGLKLNENLLDELCSLIQAFCNNTRLTCNRGFTPIELANRLNGSDKNTLPGGFPFNS